ncbi:MAG: hypothetical protein NC124_15915 [Clostridium sp.]|nr:hypothetical protein [Clostridium sp.]
MKIINITGENFDFIDCSESNIFLEKFSEGETFKLKIWGVTLMHELGISEKESYIAAISDIVFKDVAYIVMSYGIYADEQGAQFVYNMDGHDIHMKLELGKKHKILNCNEYNIGGILGRNIGYAEFKVYCRGKVELIFNEKALIDAREFCMNPEKYRLSGKK